MQLVITALVVPARVGKSVVGVGGKEPVMRRSVSFSASTSFLFCETKLGHHIQSH